MEKYTVEVSVIKIEKRIKHLLGQGVLPPLKKSWVIDGFGGTLWNRRETDVIDFDAGLDYLGRERVINIIDKETFELVAGEPQMPLSANKPRVFVVYGHDRDALSMLELTLRRIGAEPLIFDQLPVIGSQTIIEVLEDNIPKADAIVVLLTPDDVGRERNSNAELEPRARQNTLIEAGYAVISRRSRSLLISLGGVTIPTDFEGIHRVQGSKWSNEVARDFANRLHDMGLNVDSTKLRL